MVFTEHALRFKIDIQLLKLLPCLHTYLGSCWKNCGIRSIDVDLGLLQRTSVALARQPKLQRAAEHLDPWSNITVKKP